MSEVKVTPQSHRERVLWDTAIETVYADIARCFAGRVSRLEAELRGRDERLQDDLLNAMCAARVSAKKMKRVMENLQQAGYKE